MSKCINCKNEFNLKPILKKGTSCGDEDDYSKKNICKVCIRYSEEYGVCNLCGEEHVYHIEDLKEYCGVFYCDEHYEEVVPYDEDDEYDLETYSEYHLDPSHW